MSVPVFTPTLLTRVIVEQVERILSNPDEFYNDDDAHVFLSECMSSVFLRDYFLTRGLDEEAARLWLKASDAAEKVAHTANCLLMAAFLRTDFDHSLALTKRAREIDRSNTLAALALQCACCVEGFNFREYAAKPVPREQLDEMFNEYRDRPLLAVGT